VLGRCAALDTVGFKANRIAEVPDDALPPALRWLILTDNRIAALPQSLGRCTRLRKLMLAGNRLAALPSTMGGLHDLELIRLAANRFESAEAALPRALLELPRLAWIAYAGNPFNAAQEAHPEGADPVVQVDWTTLAMGALLGEGASGHIHAATWTPSPHARPMEVAVKKFKGAVTSDGLPASEMAACIAAGTHPFLVRIEGRLAGHPAHAQGLVMQRIPPGFRNLAGPPSMASCTRDVYADDSRFTADEARSIAHGVASALAHLHARGLVHGDLYAHNILVDARCTPLLGDFGAASFVPTNDAWRAETLHAIDRRALAVLVEELAARCDDPSALESLRPTP
jgi:hypothetical protein